MEANRRQRFWEILVLRKRCTIDCTARYARCGKRFQALLWEFDTYADLFDHSVDINILAYDRQHIIETLFTEIAAFDGPLFVCWS
jgi:hypothetical protein